MAYPRPAGYLVEMDLRGNSELDPELDARLVARCVEGDARAWEALVRRHERLVYAIGRSYRLDDDDLADVFQEVFTALLKGLPRLREGRTLVRWLSSTAERIVRTTALRRRKQVAREDHDSRTFDQLASEGEAVGAELEAIERQHRVRLAMGTLSERCKRLLEALYYEDPTPSYGELSKRLGVPVGSLGPTRARCMDKMKASLGDAAGGIST
jgi:RNA polymerase sigma factor (sigma-70 family)